MITPNNLNLISYFPFIGIITIVISFWQQTRNFISKIFRLFWKKRSLPYDFAYQFYRELSKDSITFNLDDYVICKFEYYSLKHKKNLPVLLKLPSFEIFLYKKFIPIFIFGDGSGSFDIQYLKYTFNFEKFLKNIVELTYKNISEQSVKEDRFWIEEKKGKSLKSIREQSNETEGNLKPSNYIASSEKMNNRGPILEAYRIIGDKLNKTIGIDVSDIVYSMPQSNKNKYQFTKMGNYVLSQVEKWIDARNWYEERNINWRRGLLLNGSSGTGKSSLILEIAKKVKIPLYIFDLSSMDNHEFDKALKDICSNSAIILFEDIDNVFNGRENITKTQQFGGLNFDYFINKLSGVNSIKNKFIFITTNYIDKIDSAILRPGRIDEKIELPSLNMEEKLNMARIILNNDELTNKVMDNSEELTTAEFENKVVQMSLNEFWKERE